MKYYPHILCVILVLVIAFQWNGNEKLAGKIATEVQKVKDAESRVLELNIEKEELKAKDLELQNLVKSLTLEISKSKAQIKIIQKERDEKIHAVDNIPSGMLQGYFSNRYGSGSAK